MKPRAARRRFYGLMHGAVADLDSMTPRQALDLMARFYKHDRFNNCDPLLDQDLLFYRWGPRHLDRGDWFEFTIGRQLTDGSKIGRSIRQLRLSFRYVLDDDLKPLATASDFCRSPANSDAFRQQLSQQVEFELLSAKGHTNVDMFFGPV